VNEILEILETKIPENVDRVSFGDYRGFLEVRIDNREPLSDVRWIPRLSIIEGTNFATVFATILSGAVCDPTLIKMIENILKTEGRLLSNSFLGYRPPDIEESVITGPELSVAPLFSLIINNDQFESNQTEKLGQGVFGEVFGGVFNGQSVAVKFIHAESRKKDARGQNFGLCSVLREIMTQKYCQHPTILALNGWNFLTGDSPKFVVLTEKMMNGTLTINKIRQLTPTERMIIMYGSARGFEYMHSRHIMHRDIKPENILLDEKNRPRICDLGMAKMAAEEGMTATMGSLSFMAPEVLNSNVGVWGYPADVYAFAISCYFIAGETRWPKPGIRSNLQLQSAIIKGIRPDVKNFPNQNFATILTIMWSHTPTERWTFKQVADAFEKSENWLPGVDRKEFCEYVEWLKNQQISFPPAGLGLCLQRVKLATPIVDKVSVSASIIERFAVLLSLVCSDEVEEQREISEFILGKLNENGSLSHIEAVNVSEALIEDTEVAENTGGTNQDGEDIVEEEEDKVEEKEWVKPEGEHYQLRVLRNGQVFAIELTFPGEATLTDLYRTLESLLGVGVTIRTVKRVFQRDSKDVLTELNLKKLLLDVVVNPN
jgi:serine/threonine protein kinase